MSEGENSRDLSKEWREEERKLINKGLMPKSSKLLHCLCIIMRKKYGV